MWCDRLPPQTSWTVLWRNLIICGRCSGIRRIDTACSACGDPIPRFVEQVILLEDGRKLSVPAAFMGAEGRFEDYIYLKMIEREWKRPVLESDQLELPAGRRPSPRAAIALLFWTYFETRIERLFRSGMRNVPIELAEDALRRYSFIGARLDRFYRIIFGTTYSADLTELGYADVSNHLSNIQRRRNDFIHGDPNAIDDALVALIVEKLEVEHDSWIAVFNKRVARDSTG
jgi:hypothetical protein